MQLIGRLSMMKKLLIGPLVVIAFLLFLAGMAYRGWSDQKQSLAIFTRWNLETTRRPSPLFCRRSAPFTPM